MTHIRKTKAYKELTSYLAVARAEGFCEGEEATRQEQIAAWQYIVDRGLLAGLQGWFGRTANSMIEQGIISPRKS